MGGVGGRVAIGATAEAAINVLPMALGRLIERRPQIQVSTAGGSFQSLARSVHAGELDFILGVVPAEDAGGNLRAEPLFSDELQVVVRPQHPLASRDALGLGDLAQYRWIQSTSDGPLTHLLRSSFADAGVAFPENSIVIEPLSSMRAILRRTDLVAAATSMRVLDELELGQLIALPIPLPQTRHIVSIVRRDEAYLSGWAKELIALLKRVSGELGVGL
jgi:LysR family transcriptional regulator of gallate degradation